MTLSLQHSTTSPLADAPQYQFVYVIEAIGTGLVKIGYTTDMESRLRSLRSASPCMLRVLGVITGGMELEHELHQRFATARSHLEWFHKTDEIQDFISTLDAYVAPVKTRRISMTNCGRPRQREEVKQNLTIRISPLLRRFFDSYEGISIAEYVETHFRESREFKTWVSRRTT